MSRKPAGDTDDPAMRALEIEERQAEVDRKKAHAESARADAAKKRKDAGLEDMDPETARKLGGGFTRGTMITVMRRRPGEARWPFWRRNVSVDEIDSLDDYIRTEGDPKFEHKVIIHKGDGKPIKEAVYFQAEETAESAGPAGDVDRQIKELDARLEERRKLRKLERRRRQLEEEEDEEDGEGGGQGDMIFVPHLGGYFPPGHPAVMGMYQGQGFGQPKEDGTAGILKALVPVLVAWITKDQGKSPMQDVAFIKMLVDGSHSGQLSPKDMMGMLQPFVLEMSKASSESNKLVMSSMAEMDQEFRGRMLDMILKDPDRTPDEIEKWSKWLSFGESALRKGAGIVKDALKNQGGAPPKDPKKIENKKGPTSGNLPGPKAKGEIPEGGGDIKSPEAPEAEAPADPRANAAAVRKQRVDMFLLAMEEEMLIESDPVLMAEKSQEIYLALPLSLRRKVEETTDDDPPRDEKMLELFGMLKEISPDVVARIGETIMASEENQEWLKAFLYACSHEDEEEEAEETEGGDEEAGPAAGVGVPG